MHEHLDFQSIFREELLGVHQCSESIRGARGADSDGCKWVTEEYSDTCPFSNKEDTETEIEFKFQVPRLPDAAAETRFRWASFKMSNINELLSQHSFL